jgi:hypothetical protein
VFHSVFERLADASQRHFDAVTTATAAGAPARAPAATAADESQFTAGGRR